MAFDIDLGLSSDIGPRTVNEDCCAAAAPPRHESERGYVAAIADGVSAGGLGRTAAQTAVLSLINDYHAVPPTWETSVALERLISAHNAWLADHNRRRSDDASGLSTLTAVVLQGQRWTVAHVGDTRAWLWRDGELTALTSDHAMSHPDLRARLTRALGLEDVVRLDVRQGPLQLGDVLLLSCDGVHHPLAPARIAEHLARVAAGGAAQAAAEALVAAALQAGGQDNATVVVLAVRGLDAQGLDDALLAARALPVPGPLKLGDGVDGYTVTALVADNGVNRLYQAREAGTRRLVALKTLAPGRAHDLEERVMLAHEAWLGRLLTERHGRVGEPGHAGFVHVHPQPARASAFYVVFDWHGGATLEQLLAQQRASTTEDAVAGTLALLRALALLHRQRVVHRDIKPANLHLGDDGQWRILDLGAAISGREPESVRLLHAGTPSYMNPEQWLEPGQGEGAAIADAMSDLYAIGVTLYQWLTGRLPYGEIEPYQIARYRRDPVAPSRLRPELPLWLDHVVLKAVARDRRQRFETAEEFALALERGASRPLNAPPPTPLVRRDPAAALKLALGLSLGLNVLLLGLWMVL
ncbi:MAG: hypothetical protein RLY78_626 [Pseudomonadota bacterium]|jgi:serine/threonine protein phosphatase PrpC|uniref:Bifunctional protein-serine/threonine kinase/phosphatase n=1 Tax=Pseudaquabacterium rugosum TaxID=2984194 RepID=A0ABU9B6P2_9BURK